MILFFFFPEKATVGHLSPKLVELRPHHWGMFNPEVLPQSVFVLAGQMALIRILLKCRLVAFFPPLHPVHKVLSDWSGYVKLFLPFYFLLVL